MGEFLEKFGGQLAERRAAQWLGPLLFWIGGAVAWASHVGWTVAAKQLEALTKEEKVALAFCGIVVLTLSAALAQRLAEPILKLLEGYWPAWTDPAKKYLTERKTLRLVKGEQRFQELTANQNLREFSALERDELTALESRLRSAPTRSTNRMPTSLGNILRAAEERIASRYGLDVIVCWPRLWLLLPDATRRDLGDARDALDSIAVAWLWSVLFLLWTVWMPWAALISFAGVVLAYRWIVDAATVYCTLLESVFDLYRGELYKAIRWYFPIDVEAEREAGRRLTRYLWRGL
jgi:hypothetical protein